MPVITGSLLRSKRATPIKIACNFCTASAMGVTLMVVGTALYLWWVRWSIYNLFLEFFSASALQEACCISCA